MTATVETNTFDLLVRLKIEGYMPWTRKPTDRDVPARPDWQFSAALCRAPNAG